MKIKNISRAPLHLFKSMLAPGASMDLPPEVSEKDMKRIERMIKSKAPVLALEDDAPKRAAKGETPPPPPAKG